MWISDWGDVCTGMLTNAHGNVQAMSNNLVAKKASDGCWLMLQNTVLQVCGNAFAILRLPVECPVVVLMRLDG
jgi:hypothetical protein